ncbi:hypothetical protein C8R46DRAFT_1309226 [Mycena filopes]|nr:hypothetical protein C8R46DRAFT_1309226 [Mycena filopes]
MYSPPASQSIIDQWDRRWPAPPHHNLPAPTNGVRLRLPFDVTPPHAPLFRDDHETASGHPALRLPTPTRDWNPSHRTLFAPPTLPYQPLPAELEPLPQYGGGAFTNAPERYEQAPFGGSKVEDDDSFDMAALADQYLDLSDHCPLPNNTRSPSPASTSTSDVPDVDLRAAKRRRVADVRPRISLVWAIADGTPKWDFLHVPASDDGYSDGASNDGSTERTALSPFYHSPPPARERELEPAHTHTHPASSRAGTSVTSVLGAPALKFTEARKDGRSKRQKLACLFCRSRKIACGGPPEGSSDTTCDQCLRRERPCEYPAGSRRGQHSRIKSLARRAAIAHNLSLGMLLPVLD